MNQWTLCYAGWRPKNWAPLVRDICCFIEGNHFDRCEVIYSCNFNLHFSDDQWHWSFPPMSINNLYILFEEVYIHALCLIFEAVICLPGVEMYNFIIYFRDQPLIGYAICENFLPCSWLSFHFIDYSFCCAKVFFFYFAVPLVYFFLYLPFPKRYISKNITATDVWYFTAYVFF